MATSENSRGDAQFSGSIPALYQRLLVPMIFQGPADLLASAIAETGPATILETAAGTGALTRALAHACPDATIVASDVNQPMLDLAAQSVATRHVHWHQADALNLPFDAGAFDVVACQFGAMFFPSKVRGYAEARRVLRPGGSFFFNVWSRLEENEIPAVVAEVLHNAAPNALLDFMGRIPHGYYDPELIRADLDDAGLETLEVTSMVGTCTTTPTYAATAFCQGTPLRAQIEAAEGLDLDEATVIAAHGLARHFGSHQFIAKVSWIQIHARRPAETKEHRP